MSKKEVTEYYCDVCGKVFRDENNKMGFGKIPLTEVMIPSRNYDCEGRNFSKGTVKVDMCDNCYEGYWNYVQNRYDVSDCNGVEIRLKEVSNGN